MIALATIAMSAAYTPVMPLADAYALQGLGHARPRLWSGAAVGLGRLHRGGNLGAGVLARRHRARHLIWLIVAAFAVAAVASPFLAPVGTGRPSAVVPATSARAFLRSRSFLMVAAAAGLIQASHAVYYGFSTLDWTAKGLDGAAIGALWALGVAAEIVLFAVSGRLRLEPATFLMIGAGGGVVRWAAMALDPPSAMLPILQTLHGLSFGATHLGAVQYLSRAAPDGLGATAQGYLTVVLGVIMAAAMVVSGLLVGAFASLAYLAMAALAFCGGLCALAVRRRAAMAGPPDG